MTGGEAVNLRLTRDELEHLILWGHMASRRAGEVGVPYDQGLYQQMADLTALQRRPTHDDLV